MNTKHIIENALKSSLGLVKTYLKDLSEAEMFIRPAEGANHLAWQLGHLIGSEQKFISLAVPSFHQELPEGFAEKHTNETAALNTSESFFSKSEYIQLLDQVRTETITALQNADDSVMDSNGPERLKHIAPTVADLFLFAASHLNMHAGQIAVLRRKLGKPILV